MPLLIKIQPAQARSFLVLYLQQTTRQCTQIFLRLLAVGNVTRHLRETLQPALIVQHWRDNDIGLGSRSVSADPPSLILKPAFFDCPSERFTHEKGFRFTQFSSSSPLPLFARVPGIPGTPAQDRKPVREFEKIEHIQDSNLQRGAGSDHCVWLRSLELLAITQLRTQAIITAMGTLLYPRPITTIPVSVTCHPWARSASRS